MKKKLRDIINEAYHVSKTHEILKNHHAVLEKHGFEMFAKIHDDKSDQVSQHYSRPDYGDTRHEVVLHHEKKKISWKHSNAKAGDDGYYRHHSSIGSSLNHPDLNKHLSNYPKPTFK